MHHHCASISKTVEYMKVGTHTRMLFLIRRPPVKFRSFVSIIEDSHRDVYELDEVSNETHDGESYSNRLADLNKFCKIEVELRLKTMVYVCVPFCEGFVQRVRN